MRPGRGGPQNCGAWRVQPRTLSRLTQRFDFCSNHCPGENSIERMIIFVTGATSGFGKAVARTFARDGAKIIGTGRRKNRLNELQQELGANFLPLTFDVSQRKQVEEAIVSLPEEFAAVDILLNNAGGAMGLDPAYTANLDDWETMVDANVKGVLYCTRFLLPGMVER